MEIIRLSVLVNFLCFGLVNGQNYNVLDFDATGDGQTDDSNAFVKTWNAACGGGGEVSTLLIPAGRTFLIQPIVFNGPCRSSNTKVQLEGIIVAPSNKEAWSNPNSRMWIKFSAVLGLVIVGSGTINGRGDDCIAINTGNTNINVTRINCGPGHGISVGSLGINGGNAAVSDVRVTQCTFNQTMNGARIKTWPGGQGYARNISFENITLINAKNPIIIDQQYLDKGRVYSAEPVRSVSLPSRIHPLSVKLRAALKRLSIWHRSSSSICVSTSLGFETLLIGIVNLTELYGCIHELLESPYVRHTLLHHQKGKLIDDSLNGSVVLLDVCEAATEVIVTTREHVMNLKSALRRQGSVEKEVRAYVNLRKKAKKELSKHITALKKMETLDISTNVDQDPAIASTTETMQNEKMKRRDVDEGVFVIWRQNWVLS
ncbi:hypothetical protein HA466_0223180 [Hirschfeldia incana]|nr:hypothetical protein HA466_0223180 [Hirschfeldia incana]